MFDNLRDDASSAFYEDNDSDLFPEESPVSPPPAKSKPRRRGGKFLGMTSMQRFIIAVMLMVATCTLGAMCLLVTGRVGLF